MSKHDAHIHLNDDNLIHVMINNNISCIANADSKEEFQMLMKLRELWPKLYISAGIHPWKVDCTKWEDMSSVLEEVSIIGEIGLDRVWCTSDMQRQKDIFVQQLHYASIQHKPVILHTKGMEQEVLSLLKKYHNTYLVHWYSHDQFLEDYINEGCWFTIGPSVGTDETVNNVARLVPMDRLLIETDGLDAISWCEGYEVGIDSYCSILQRSMKQIASLRSMSVMEVEKQLHANFDLFIKKISK